MELVCGERRAPQGKRRWGRGGEGDGEKGRKPSALIRRQRSRTANLGGSEETRGEELKKKYFGPEKGKPHPPLKSFLGGGGGKAPTSNQKYVKKKRLKPLNGLVLKLEKSKKGENRSTRKGVSARTLPSAKAKIRVVSLEPETKGGRRNPQGGAPSRPNIFMGNRNASTKGGEASAKNNLRHRRREHPVEKNSTRTYRRCRKRKVTAVPKKKDVL